MYVSPIFRMFMISLILQCDHLVAEEKTDLLSFSLFRYKYFFSYVLVMYVPFPIYSEYIYCFLCLVMYILFPMYKCFCLCTRNVYVVYFYVLILFLIMFMSFSLNSVYLSCHMYP